VPKQVRDKIKELNVVVENTARWVARATYAAGHQTVKPFRDTDASRAAAAAAARLKADCQEAKRGSLVARPTLRPTESGGRGGARLAKEKVRRAQKWPSRYVAVRRRYAGRGKKRCVNQEVESFRPLGLRPLVHALTGAERRAAILQRVRAKEAARQDTALPKVANTIGAVEIATISRRIVGKRPQGSQLDAAAGELGGASKRQRLLNV
jgi:hypothetical protein